MVTIIFLSTLFCFVLSRVCNSDHDATYCQNDLKCCDGFGNCGTTERVCRFYAKNYSCEYMTDCNYCCLTKNGVPTCGSYQECTTYVIIIVSLWLGITLIVVALICWKRQRTIQRQKKIEHHAQKAEQEDLSKNIHFEKQRNDSLAINQEDQTAKFQTSGLAQQYNRTEL